MKIKRLFLIAFLILGLLPIGLTSGKNPVYKCSAEGCTCVYNCNLSCTGDPFFCIDGWQLMWTQGSFSGWRCNCGAVEIVCHGSTP